MKTNTSFCYTIIIYSESDIIYYNLYTKYVELCMNKKQLNEDKNVSLCNEAQLDDDLAIR